MAEAKTTRPSVDYIKKGVQPPQVPIPRQEINVPTKQGQDPPPNPAPSGGYRD